MNPHAYHEISAVIDRLEQDQILLKAGNFIERMKAIDVLEIQMLDGIEQVPDSQLNDAEKLKLMQRAETLTRKLADANEKLFNDLLDSIRSNDRSVVKEYFKKAEQELAQRADDDYLGYDEIDMLVNGLLEVGIVPDEPDERTADMLFYQPTPARIILKIIDELHLTANDIFYDIGSGIGHVPILVTLLTDIQTKGIELQDVYFRYSIECLKKLALSNVEFIKADARDVDYTDGTIFYLYTPFRGAMLQQVMDKLEAISQQRQIRVCSYGPCTLPIRKQRWLKSIYQAGKQEGSLGIFVSL